VVVQYQQATVERMIFAAFEPASLGVDFEQPVDGLGLETCRLGHSLGGAAGWRAQQKLGALHRKDAQDRSAVIGRAASPSEKPRACIFTIPANAAGGRPHHSSASNGWSSPSLGRAASYADLP